jgi:hypothetical protein
VSAVPSLEGVVTADEVRETAGQLASLQLPNGMIQWFPGGHSDPWNHIESAMALDIAGLHKEAEHAYEWLADIQRSDGSWHNYYRPDGSVEDAKIDTNVCAYIATGVWHHWRSTWDRGFAENMWPTVERALDFVLSLRRNDGIPLWAIEPDGQPWDYALLTGTASIQHALRCGAHLGEAIGSPRPEWSRAAATMCEVIRSKPEAFEPKTRWAMDWYYPVLTSALTGTAAKVRMESGWDRFVIDGLGVRCVDDEPWITASETAECALACAVMGDISTATDLLEWIRPHRNTSTSGAPLTNSDNAAAPGAYWTGIVHDLSEPTSGPSRVLFPFDEHSSYTAAAVILAVDAITQTTQASNLFVERTGFMDPSDRTAIRSSASRAAARNQTSV